MVHWYLQLCQFQRHIHSANYTFKYIHHSPIFLTIIDATSPVPLLTEEPQLVTSNITYFRYYVPSNVTDQHVTLHISSPDSAAQFLLVQSTVGCPQNFVSQPKSNIYI